MQNKLFLLIALLLFLSACTKESEQTISENVNPIIGETPVIELVSISTTSVQANADSIAFKISYTDGDGDLGTADPDITSIELIDNRDPEFFIFTYHLSPRTPEGSDLTIQGELDIVLNNTILVDDALTSETTTFSIRLKDRAGNWSNVVETEEVEVLP
ncbi:MAG: hypothetical protein AB8F74_01905 [Saprospiraceae bacterium]